MSRMASTERNGHHTYTRRNREILDKCYANPEMFNQPKSGKSLILPPSAFEAA